MSDSYHSYAGVSGFTFLNGLMYSFYFDVGSKRDSRNLRPSRMTHMYTRVHTDPETAAKGTIVGGGNGLWYEQQAAYERCRRVTERHNQHTPKHIIASAPIRAFHRNWRH